MSECKRSKDNDSDRNTTKYNYNNSDLTANDNSNIVQLTMQDIRQHKQHEMDSQRKLKTAIKKRQTNKKECYNYVLS